MLPASLAVPKELLPLGRWPALTAVLLEAIAAGLPDIVVVVSPGKEALRTFLEPDRWGAVGGRPILEPLRALLAQVRVRFTEQPEPHGVLDAVERGRRLLEPGPYAVLFPDQLHLPDQRGLAALVRAHAACGETVFALVDGATLAADASSAVADLAPGASGDALVLRGVRRAARSPRAELCTVFAGIHAPAYVEAVERIARVGEVLVDSRHLDALGHLAQGGRLFGHALTGEILDLGNPTQYGEAARRFATGEAAFRGLPP